MRCGVPARIQTLGKADLLQVPHTSRGWCQDLSPTKFQALLSNGIVGVVRSCVILVHHQLPLEIPCFSFTTIGRVSLRVSMSCIRDAGNRREPSSNLPFEACWARSTRYMFLFTVALFSTITSKSEFMKTSCSLQS